ncbi:MULTISPECIES: universal stress protein [unclassified Flavobacterium]|uniref:universal stress protein n=1 Tax=unclassified Flavobacterium TaxID=196869 RepID=UPI000969834E|nr:MULTISPECIES: universal stress protein [unclassified Flavobacterium]MBN9284905.1 universal stress protein [Flavobacterium sp.]OJV72218.1 MAG: hypothetical protein BGO42_03255 [Flavobacterium sp. 40-81]
MKKILFPTDFSETANNAFIYALKFANKLQAEVLVLHVYDLPPISYEGHATAIVEVFETIELDKFENFKDQIPSLRKIAEDNDLGYIKMQHLLKQGDLIHVIKEVVKEEEIDMVVMGTTGATGWQETFFGSNTGSAITNVSKNILSVPNDAKFDIIRNIAFTTRFREQDKEGLYEVIKFAKMFNAKIKCLAVKTKNFEGTEELIEQWRQEFEKQPVEFFVVPDDDVKQTIFDFLDNQHIDILSMVTYKRSFFEELFRQSLTQKLSYHSKTPILVLHE